MNLKGNFRTKVLEKLGYKVMNVHTDDFGDGSFAINLKVLNEIKKLENS